MDKDIKSVVRYYQLRAMKSWMENYLKRAFVWTLVYFGLSYLFHFFKYVCYMYVAIFALFWLSGVTVSVISIFYELFNYNIPHCKFGKRYSVTKQYELLTKEDKEIHERVRDIIIEDYYEAEDFRYRAVLIRHFEDLCNRLGDEFSVKLAYVKIDAEEKEYLNDLKSFMDKLTNLKNGIIEFFSGDSELVDLAKRSFDVFYKKYDDELGFCKDERL